MEEDVSSRSISRPGACRLSRERVWLLLLIVACYLTEDDAADDAVDAPFFRDLTSKVEFSLYSCHHHHHLLLLLYRTKKCLQTASSPPDLHLLERLLLLLLLFTFASNSPLLVMCVFVCLYDYGQQLSLRFTSLLSSCLSLACFSFSSAKYISIPTLAGDHHKLSTVAIAS